MKTGPICPHLKKSSSTTYICLPLIGKGEIIGLLHLGTKRPVQEDDKQANIFELKEIAVMFAEYFSLSIANIKLSEKLTSQSVRDPLTRLYNRRYMDEIIQHEILRAARQQTGIGVVMIDIDHFKQINDTYGHEAGDEFLTRLADFFRLQIRRSDFIFRYGGEEFVLVLPESSVEDTYKYAESLRKEIKNMKINFRDQQLPSITLSFGISAYPDLGLDTIELIRIADKALYKAKEAGRDRVVIGAQDTAVDITERKHAKEELQGSLNSLSKEFNTIVQVLISSIEMKDPYTASHQRWSANIACAIATEMGLPQDKIDGLRMAGSMHDIGKLSIPAEILSKPTKLTEIEFSLIKEHSRSGYEMLKDVESPWPLAQIVYQHHERMNGSGYPRNLKGDEILMESRILAVADIVEAMASYRPYRAALGIEAALEEIEKNKGVFYDDAVADACLRLFREKGYQLKYDGETNPVEKT
jgi:diguanylate cyclase (GGDEF)-like protein